MGLISGITALIGRTQSLGQTDTFLEPCEGRVEFAEPTPWSTRRMLFVSAVVSAGLWAPIVYLAAKALG